MSAETTRRITAALVVIGDEILSGRTIDSNTTYIARFLTQAGIDLREVRVVPDLQADIVAAVNALRVRYTYVFTTGGIGPTHDDITTDAIAAAFGVAVAEHPRAVAALQSRFPDQPLSYGRLRMSRIPEGAELIDNPISAAPGFQLDNVIVMAGVPRIMQTMLDHVIGRLDKARPVMSRSVRIDAPEGEVAPGLAAVQAAHDEVQIGSYPFFEKGRVGTYVVLRSAEAAAIEGALETLWTMIARESFQAETADGEKGG
jgi:molybdenum cofactor synthesis domain-containing protein